MSVGLDTDCARSTLVKACHAESGIGFRSDFLDLELHTIDRGGADLEKLLGRLFLLKGNETEIFPLILSFVKWLLDLKEYMYITIDNSIMS